MLAPKKTKYRKRGQVAKWLSIVWLVFLVFTAVGASWLPYVNHSCDQFATKADDPDEAARQGQLHDGDGVGDDGAEEVR